MGKLLQPDVFPAPESRAAATGPQNSHQAGKLFSIVAAREAAGGQDFIIQVAQDRSADEELTKKFGALLAIVLALGILAAAVIATSLTKRGLRPLAKMTESLRRVGPTRLDERLGATAWPAELQPMASAFDEMFKRLEQSFTRLSQFSADLAHELRTPVANIRGEAEVTLTRERSPAEYREVMESCVAECARLSGIIDNLLFLARAESADQQVQRANFDGRAAIEKIAAYYRPLCEERHVTLTCEGSGEISADAILFGRALSNLIENALRFTPAGGAITLSLRGRNGATEVSVHDTGAGISPEHLPRVFDRFYRADASRSSAGTGLGLALVKSIVALHGGTATAQSEPDQGTTVTLAFPRVAHSSKEFAGKDRP
jgi:two-component system heavy metal sensor histidine kinase CusS